MSPNGEAGPAPAGGWLGEEQQRAWLAYIRVQLRLAYEMNRQLLAGGGMSLPDYDVLTALSVAGGAGDPVANYVTCHVRLSDVSRISRPDRGRRQEGTAMPNAVVMTGYGPPEVLKWAAVPLTEPGEGQIRLKVKAAGISPTDLALRAGYLKEIPLPPNAVLGFEAAGTVDAVGPGVTGTSVGDGVAALLFSLGGYAEYAVASIWARKPDAVSWIDAAALPSSAEAAVGVLRQLNVKSGETLLLFGGGGSVGVIATQLAVAQGVKVISAVGEHDETLARELGATPVRYGAGLADRVRALGTVDAVFDAAGQGVLADAIALAGGPERVITLSDPAAADFGVTLSQPTPDRAPGALDETIASLAEGRLRLRAHKSMPMRQAAEAHRELESGNVHERIILILE
jgi:NADPH:quinone reductase-like Zn-dependent oxidoreductase